MKTLAIYDVDDTIIMVDISIGVFDADGNVYKRLTAAEYYIQAQRGELTADDCCFAQYNCADTFYNTGTFNPAIVDQLNRDLDDPSVDVWLVTGRNSPSCLDTYMSRFHHHGVMVPVERVIFAADGTSGEARTHTSIMKKPHYQRLITHDYNRVTAYEDSRPNLKMLHEICVDIDMPFEGYLVDDDGSVRRFLAKDLVSES